MSGKRTVVIERHVCEVVEMEECSRLWERGLTNYLGERVAIDGNLYCYYEHTSEPLVHYASPVMQCHSGD